LFDLILLIKKKTFKGRFVCKLFINVTKSGQIAHSASLSHFLAGDSATVNLTFLLNGEHSRGRESEFERAKVCSAIQTTSYSKNIFFSEQFEIRRVRVR